MRMVVGQLLKSYEILRHCDWGLFISPLFFRLDVDLKLFSAKIVLRKTGFTIIFEVFLDVNDCKDKIWYIYSNERNRSEVI